MSYYRSAFMARPADFRFDSLLSRSYRAIYVNGVKVAAIGAEIIVYLVTGSVEATLQWGSDSDLRRGDGADAGQSFPFECEFRLPLDDPWISTSPTCPRASIPAIGMTQ